MIPVRVASAKALHGAAQLPSCHPHMRPRMHTAAHLHAGQSIRLRGRNLTESEHVKLGAYHTLELEPQRAFTLEKAVWDAIDIERMRQACDPAASADLAAVLITVLAKALNPKPYIKGPARVCACTHCCVPALQLH